MTSINTLTQSGAGLEQERPLIVRLIETVERLDPERLEQVWNEPQGAATVEESLIRAGVADEHQIARAYSEHYLLPVFDPPAGETPPIDFQVASLLPADLCREHLLAPLADDGTTMDVAIFSPDSLWLADDLRLQSGRHMRPLFAPLSVIERLLHLLYGPPRSPAAITATPITATPSERDLPVSEQPAAEQAAAEQAATEGAAIRGDDQEEMFRQMPGLLPEIDDLSRLGLHPRQRADLIAAIQNPHGLVLFTGPPQSGRTTTLHASLKHRDGARVSTINGKATPTTKETWEGSPAPGRAEDLASRLRRALRQDPDVVLIDELRDRDAAQLGLRAALAGHLVASTLPSESGLSALVRLGDVGVPPQWLGETLRAVVSQRLVRRLCASCRQPHRITGQIARQYRLSEGITAYRPGGCRRCGGTGYRGRWPVFEVIPIDDELGGLIGIQAPLETLQAAAVEAGSQLLADAVADAVAAGVTSLEEALKIPPRRGPRSG